MFLWKASQPHHQIQASIEGESVNKWIRRSLWVLLSPVLVPALVGIFVFGLIGWVLMQIGESKRQSPPLMVTGHSSCAVAMQNWKERAEGHHG